MKKCICIVGILVCVVLLLAACSRKPVRELDRPITVRGLRMTATDMLFEPCPSGDGNLIKTYFLVENTTRWRTIPVWLESNYTSRNISEGQSFYPEDIPAGESVEFYVPVVVPADAVGVEHEFYSYRIFDKQLQCLYGLFCYR